MRTRSAVPSLLHRISRVALGVALTAACGCARGATTASRPATVIVAASADSASAIIACARSLAADRGYTAVDARTYGYVDQSPSRFVAERRGSFGQKFVLVAEARPDSAARIGLWAKLTQYDADGRVLNVDRPGAPPVQQTPTPSGSAPAVWSAPTLPADAAADLTAVRTRCGSPAA